MQRHTAYTYPQPTAPATTTHRYSGTSSAFSASANPNEDWTKISDLAERRRIQNRIAQRNYRKKLKKRLEDLERRAASNSASPEPRPADLHKSPSQSQSEFSHRDSGSESADSHEYSHSRSQDSYHHSYSQQSGHDDRGLFSHQYTRQLSTSPPPFSYPSSTYPTPESVSYSPYPPMTAYHSLPSTTASESYSYLPPISSAYPNQLPSLVHQIKPEYYDDAEISPFSMSYASMAGIDIPAPLHYDSSNPQTPPLSEQFEASIAGSPPDSTAWPTTPDHMPGTPPLRFVS